MTERSGYRQKLYQRYATLMDTAATAEDEAMAAKSRVLFAHHFRGWFPLDRSAALLDVANLLAHAGFTACEARECGPIPKGYSTRSSIRYLGWAGIRTLLKIWNVVETGGAAGGIYTRVFAATGVKPG
jgi:hypothetical protein